MKISDKDRALILVQALPYIRRLSGKTIVVKYGGNAMINEEHKDAMMRDIVLMKLVGINVVLVHGGGSEISEMLERVGKKSRFIDGMRYTDKETMEIVQMVLAGKINKDLVHILENHGGRAIGLCGIDDRTIVAKKKRGSTDLGCVGEITEINTELINDVCLKGYIPVVSTVASGYGSEVFNINADIAASEIAAKLGALKLVLITDTRGLMRDKDDESTLIPVVGLSEVQNLKREDIIKDGMIPKVDCCVNAVRNGVDRAHIIDGRVMHSILIELFSNEGIGTMFY